jgi:(2Fe-2S) ferredoxin
MYLELLDEKIERASIQGTIEFYHIIISDSFRRGDFDFSTLFPILSPCKQKSLKYVLENRVLSDFLPFIKKRLEADIGFYHYPEGIVIEDCLCQGRCKEGPTLVFDNDVQVGMNPIKASEILRKKVNDWKVEKQNKKRSTNKSHRSSHIPNISRETVYYFYCISERLLCLSPSSCRDAHGYCIELSTTDLRQSWDYSQ